MEIIGIIATVMTGLITGGFLGASVAPIIGYSKEYDTESFNQVFRKMIQPVILFLFIYGTTYLMRGGSGLLIGAIVGIIPFTVNYRAGIRQLHTKYANSSKADKEVK